MITANNKQQRQLLGFTSYIEITKIESDNSNNNTYTITQHSASNSHVHTHIARIQTTKKGITIIYYDCFLQKRSYYLKPTEWQIEH